MKGTKNIYEILFGKSQVTFDFEGDSATFLKLLKNHTQVFHHIVKEYRENNLSEHDLFTLVEGKEYIKIHKKNKRFGLCYIRLTNQKFLEELQQTLYHSLHVA
ncbi:hypothetical protein HOC37_02790 [bacterium]|jgi:hypothetical protein|nr:hypothetical protein [bacterium]MBT3581553.1 hypothetical protein [bacterium]MBT4551894.1 hypothetical protein [bacterium]MBT7087488.1 hypothetical protein [bacterium]